jgi:hypothetical protein
MSTPKCGLCDDTKILTQKGIAKVYLWPRPVAGLLFAGGIILSFFYGWYMLLLSLLGYIIPLMNADMRLSLYPIVSMGTLFGKKANCPHCVSNSTIFRQEWEDNQ